MAYMAQDSNKIMKPVAFILIMLVCFALGYCLRSVVQVRFWRSKESEKTISVIVNQQVGELLSERIIYDDLRIGNVTNAVAQLESSLDTKIVIIGHGLNKVDDPTRATAIRALKIIRDYRKALPESIPSYSEDKQMAAIHEEAKAILKQLD